MKVYRIIRKGSIDEFLKFSERETLIHKVCEESAMDFILNEKELEQIQEEMLDELYNDDWKRKQAYKTIGKNILNASLKALENGKLNEAMAIGEVYNQWIDICKKANVM